MDDLYYFKTLERSKKETTAQESIVVVGRELSRIQHAYVSAWGRGGADKAPPLAKELLIIIFL